MPAYRAGGDRVYTAFPHSRGGHAMTTTSEAAREPIPVADYARLEERIVARDQLGASQALYGLIKQGRSVTELVGETVRIHAPYTHVPYHQRLDDGLVKFVNYDHCQLSERVGLPLGCERSHTAPSAGVPDLDVRPRCHSSYATS